MSGSSRSQLPVAILPCPTSEQGAALRLVFSRFSDDVRDQQVGELIDRSCESGEDLSGLLIAKQGSALRGALLVRPLAGRAAFVWPPRLAPATDEAIALELLRRGLQWLVDQGAQFAQALLHRDDTQDGDRLRAGGFRYLTELCYLLSSAQAFPTAPPATKLAFETYAATNHARLKTIIQRTYRGSQDCPELDGSRDLEDVVAGYRATGVFDPRRWLIARDGDLDVGCILLSDDPQLGHWELVYTGVAPEQRGQGWGMEMVRHAQWLARQAGRERMVVSVDARNRPALEMYDAAGFTVWDQRVVFVKDLTPLDVDRTIAAAPRENTDSGTH